MVSGSLIDLASLRATPRGIFPAYTASTARGANGTPDRPGAQTTDDAASSPNLPSGMTQSQWERQQKLLEMYSKVASFNGSADQASRDLVNLFGKRIAFQNALYEHQNKPEASQFQEGYQQATTSYNKTLQHFYECMAQSSAARSTLSGIQWGAMA
jgi:hypothetical protein